MLPTYLDPALDNLIRFKAIDTKIIIEINLKYLKKKKIIKKWKSHFNP